MALYIEIFDLFFYCIQQLGIMLGAGGETVVLLSYLLALKEGNIPKESTRFATAVARVVQCGIFFIVSSGIGITLLHYSIGQTSIVYEPAYLFKWALIGLVSAIAIAGYFKKERGPLLMGLGGGAWYGLFIVHILAPISTWGSLGFLWVVWMVLFVLSWMGLARFMGHQKSAKPMVTTVATKKAPIPVLPQQTLAYSAPQAPRTPLPIFAATPPVSKLPPPPIPLPPVIVPVVALPSVIEEVPPSPTKEARIFTHSYSPDAYPYKETALTNSPMLHPHLTQERQFLTLPTPQAPKEPLSGLQLQDAEVTAHLAAVRIMPQKPEDLETQHHRWPLVKFG